MKRIKKGVRPPPRFPSDGSSMMKKTVSLILLSGAAILAPSGTICRAAAAEEGAAGGAAHGLDPLVLFGVAVMLVSAKLGGEVFERFGQPAVLGELIAGILLGNLALFGFSAFEPLKTNAVIAAIAELGVIILLFDVGLEFNTGQMLEVGSSSLLVAVLGVVAPLFLGWGVAAVFMPDAPLLAHIFIGATLCATSVGITARVLKDIGRLKTREGLIILGAAVVDDVLGLLVLAVVAGAIGSIAAGGTLSLLDIALIASKALALLVGAIAVGHYLMPHVFRVGGRLETRGVLLALSLSFCFLLAWAAALVGLAPIVGAFAAGLVLDEVHFESFGERQVHDLKQLLMPISAVLVPIFFVLMGLKVDLRAFARPGLLGFAAVLTAVAIVSKQVCSLGVVERGVDRLAVGLGMIPRGEVGLIFAGIGAALALPDATGVFTPVINSDTFGVVVIMVIVTTLVTPPALKWAMSRRAHKEESLTASHTDTSE
jgi:Kef-type K+ transport system membrane component KefB